MKELTSEELKEVQLQIMDYVDHFCRINNINYTLACGSLLGAIRHNGFIPWDDDLDIHLLRNEYIRFTNLWNEHKDAHPYELISIESGNNMGYPYGKIHDPRTVTFVGGFERTGVFIDVFPIDYVIDEEDYYVRQAKISHLYKKRNFALNWITSRTSDVSFWRKAYAFLRKPFKSFYQFALDIDKIAQEVKTPSKYVYEMAGTIIPKRPIPATVYDKYEDCKFEGRKYRIISNYEQYLSIIYGDWRTPPPPEKQITHHGFKAYWK